ncbi:hypothetical protein C8R43DRAFT_1143432 [Mycena crocata]|nr:hypothetical protein C8R43DRAFT_1143432 [Mycena crocata]
MSSRRFLDMDALVEKYVALGDKRRPKVASSRKGPVRRGVPKTKLSPDDQLVVTEKAIENNVKHEELMKLFEPVATPVAEHEKTPIPVPDPATLCPFCDEPLPRSPSAKLLAMLEEGRAPDDRPENVLGLVVKTSIAAPICLRHVFERDQIPKAQYNGWPTTLDPKAIERRLKANKAQFDALINDGQCDGARKDNIVWQQAIKNSASAKHQGAGGTMADFHLYQPGYYGEQGMLIMDDTFRRLLVVFDASVHPLTPQQFFAMVLTPEAGVLLIMEDQNVDRTTAFGIMRESCSYGSEMFPASDSDT